jgi:hypothetical protein
MAGLVPDIPVLRAEVANAEDRLCGGAKIGPAFWTHGMTISATAVRFDENTMWVDLSDGRTLGVPLAWFPRLLHADSAQRKKVELSRPGLHWEELDEDISVAGLLAGRGDVTRQPEAAA